MVRENGNCKDGEDEKMLNGGGAGDAVATTNGGEKEKLTQKELEVTFTSEGQNGDVRINLEVEKQVSGVGDSHLAVLIGLCKVKMGVIKGPHGSAV